MRKEHNNEKYSHREQRESLCYSWLHKDLNCAIEKITKEEAKGSTGDPLIH